MDVLVIDDGSTDNTSSRATDAGALVLRNNKNEGKGASLIKGFSYAYEKGYDAIMTMDGDGQHLPQDIPIFIKAYQSGESIVIGNRMHQKEKMPLSRFLTNKFMSWLISLITGQNIPDSQCGFRLIRKDLLKKTTLKANKYEIESEILLLAAKLGYKIVSVPVTTVYNGAKSRINPLVDTFRFVGFIARYLWHHH